jgi:hypothetical protein
MKRYSLFILLLLVPSLTFADTLLPTNATITENTHFVASSSPYIIEDYLNIQAGATLVIDPGVVVKLKSRYGCIGGLGNLIIGSNTGTRTYITSYKDDTVGGDSNGDGDTTVPTRDDWTCIGSPYGEGGSYTIENTTIRYGGNYGNVGMVNVYSTSTISNTTLEEFSGSAFRIAAHTTITDSKIQGGRKAFRDLPASLIVSNTSFENIAQTVLSGRYDSRFTHVIDVRNNWWGKDTGPNVRTDRGPYGSFVGDIGTDQQVLDEGQILYSPWLTSYPVVATTPTTLATTTATSTCTTAYHSSILFLPGIMGTRLYDNQGERLWESFGIAEDTKQARLAMDQNGYSINEIHTKLDTVSDSAVIGTVATQDIYKSFIQDLQTWKNTDNLIQDYAVIPYDWRLPLDQIVQKGKVVDNKLYYGTTTSSLTDSFLIKELQRLQRDSKSGKVTIIAHSNGGLVTKELIQTLKETGSPLYNQIDKVIMVAVPQVGTPEAVGALLHGSKVGPFGAVMSAERQRDLTQNMPVAYNLLPSRSFFESINPLIEFSGSNADPIIVQKYGQTINTYEEYLEYIKGDEGRINPDYSDLKSALRGNEALLTQSVSTHQRLDSWLPASSTEVVQIAGWGVYTPSGLKYNSFKQCALLSNSGTCSATLLKTTVSDQVKLNGDGTVLSGSALFMGTGEKVRNYWVDLLRYNESNFSILPGKKHADIFEVKPLLPFLKNLITSSTTTTQYISTSEPTTPLNSIYTTYRIHSPLHLTITDSLGNITGYSTTTNQTLEQIPGSSYREIADVKTVFLPQDTVHTVTLSAYASGSFTVEKETLVGDTILDTTRWEGIPNSTSTLVTLTIATTTPTLVIDFDGDGTVDKKVGAPQNTTTVYTNEIATTTPSIVQPVQISYGGGYYNTQVEIRPTPASKQQSASTSTTQAQAITTRVATNTVQPTPKKVTQKKSTTVKEMPEKKQLVVSQQASILLAVPEVAQKSFWQRVRVKINRVFNK